MAEPPSQNLRWHEKPPEYYELSAIEIRQRAEWMEDVECRDKLLQIASNYDRMAAIVRHVQISELNLVSGLPF